MSTKGASRRYHGTRGSRYQNPTTRINFPYAKGFNKSTLNYHFNHHGKQMGCKTKWDYASKAVKFANKVDSRHCESFVDNKGTTYKYNKVTNEFAMITKKGIVITYFKPKEGKKYFDLLRKNRALNHKSRRKK